MRSFLIVLFLVIATGFSLYYYKNSNVAEVQKVAEATSSPISIEPNTEIIATFKIITNGTTRIFSDSRYHNLSNDAYITSQNPNTIVVKKSDIKWSDFFKTLPMSLDKNCLVTGTKQTFCTNETRKLYFYINNTETPNALDNPIQNNDFLLVEYK